MINLINNLIILIKIVIVVSLGIVAAPLLAIGSLIGFLMILVLTADVEISYASRNNRK